MEAAIARAIDGLIKLRGGAAASALAGICFWAGPKAKNFMQPFDYAASATATVGVVVGVGLLVIIACRAGFAKVADAPN